MTIIKKEFHPNGNIAFEETRSGFKHYYNERGQKVRSEFFNQVDIWDYNEDGQLIHWKHAHGKDCWREYDENGRLIREWEDGGYDGRWEYDEKGRISCFYDITNTESPAWYVYDDNNTLIKVCRTHDEYVKLTSGDAVVYPPHDPIKKEERHSKEIHFYESISVIPTDKNVVHDWESINEIWSDRERVGDVHTTQMCMLSTSWILSGYRIFVHQGNGVVYEITLKDKDHNGDRAIRVSQNMYAMWASNVFRE